MKTDIEQRVCEIADYIVANRCTVRAAATRFRISKSTVHKDITDRLKAFNHSLYKEVKLVLDENKSERHLRGGIATKNKYKAQKIKSQA